MTDPHESNNCGLGLGDSGLLSVADVSYEFGPGAIAVSCRCGAWLVEDETGSVVARADFAGAA